MHDLVNTVLLHLPPPPPPPPPHLTSLSDYKPEAIPLGKLREVEGVCWRDIMDMERLFCFSAAKINETVYLGTMMVGTPVCSNLYPDWEIFLINLLPALDMPQTVIGCPCMSLGLVQLGARAEVV